MIQYIADSVEMPVIEKQKINKRVEVNFGIFIIESFEF